jgi:glyoxylase-like metal-dependent hydrolase (beta-lactamase superfamily II)
VVDAALAQLDPPRDPREAWDLPAFGGLPAVTHLDERVTRVLAPNPSPMTLDGTNTYVIGEPGTGEAIVVDPGPDDREHLRRVEAELGRRDARCVAVVVTHHHVDHAEAARPWATRFGCRLVATPLVAGDDGEVLADGDELRAGGVTVTAVAVAVTALATVLAIILH